MPKRETKAKPAAPVAPTPPPAPPPTVAEPTVAAPDGRKVVDGYEVLKVVEYSTTSPKGPLTIDRIVKLLGWETEKQYQERKVAENPGTKPEHWLYGEEFHCRNVAGEKVRCRYNANNRPFDEKWCEQLVHTVLYGQWAGPHTIPGGTVNGETVRISRYGYVLSGQHQMTAAKLADEQLAKDRAAGLDHAAAPKYPAWAKCGQVFLETIVVTGMSEDPRVLMTVDYCKPRSAADVFYTSDRFRDSTSPQRKELCRMLATATDTLWTRTKALGYRTHPEVVAFLDRHASLLAAVEHLFAENNEDDGRRVTRLRISPGQAAAIMYLMAASPTLPEDSDVYRNMEPPTEKGIDLGAWDRAEAFWSLLVGDLEWEPVREALNRLRETVPDGEANQGLGGRVQEKLAILAKAWERWKDHNPAAGPAFDDSDIAPGGFFELAYSDKDEQGRDLPPGQVALIDDNDFGGIDCPPSLSSGGGTARRQKDAAPEPPPPTPEALKKLYEEADERRRQAGMTDHQRAKEARARQ